MMITDEILLDLIDGRFSKEKADQIWLLIDEDSQIRKRYNELNSVDEALIDQPLKNPSTLFGERVMANLTKRFESKTFSFRSNGLLIAFGVIAGGLISAIVLLSNFPVTDIIPTSVKQITFQENTITFDPGSYINQDLFFKGLIYLNGFLGLFLFERAVLRPFFKQRRQHLTF